MVCERYEESPKPYKCIIPQIPTTTLSLIELLATARTIDQSRIERIEEITTSNSKRQNQRSIKVYLYKEQLQSSARPLLRAVCERFFWPSSAGFVDMNIQHIPCPKRAAKGNVNHGYTGALLTLVAQDMIKCSARRIDTASLSPPPLMMHITELIPSSDSQSFSALRCIIQKQLLLFKRWKFLAKITRLKMTKTWLRPLSPPQDRT